MKVVKPIKLGFTLFNATYVFDRIIQRIERDEGQIFTREIEAVVPTFHESVSGNILFDGSALEINVVKGAMVLIGLLLVARDIIINHHVIVSDARQDEC